ncbi:MAG TPA: tryptophan-rich sensory protein [Oscillospiraceae bacterium]|nr:tryptophan-rich sensory protein [Oscillospiraceae bacterium]HPS35623.1 tryptophan-rich sensory protein [Oscillospiraceae bacterium]
MKTTRKAVLNLVSLLITLAVNTLGAIGLINGLTQKQISDMYVTLITPGPLTFSIWSVIYALLLISVIVMIARKKDPYYQEAIERITALFWLSCILNVAWIVMFSFVQVEISTLFIAAFLVTLALIDKKLLEIRQGRRWLLPLTFGLYSGWLFIATVVNAAAALTKLGWNGFGLSNELWAIIMLSVAVVLLGLVMLKLRNAAFPLPVAWAYFGIYLFLKAPEGFQGQYGTLETVSLAGAALLVVIALIAFWRNRFSVLPAGAKK